MKKYLLLILLFIGCSQPIEDYPKVVAKSNVSKITAKYKCIYPLNDSTKISYIFFSTIDAYKVGDEVTFLSGSTIKNQMERK